jgi:hypothetical protein
MPRQVVDPFALEKGGPAVVQGRPLLLARHHARFLLVTDAPTPLLGDRRRVG